MATQTAPPDVTPASPADRPPHHRLRLVLKIVGAVVGVLFLAWAILFITKGRFLKSPFQSIASRVTQRQVRVGGDFQLYFAPITIKFVADGLRVSNPAWASKPDFFAADHIGARISTFRLLFGQRHARRLDLVNAFVDAEWDAAHQHNTWTFGSADRRGKPFQMPVIDQATAAGTTLRYRDPVMQLATDQRLQTVEARGQRIDSTIRFAGDGTLRGKPFSNTGVLLSPNSTLTLGRTRLALQANSGATHLDLTGVLPAATRLEGADLQMAVHGPDARLLFDLLGVAIPDTRAYHFRSHLTKTSEEWRFHHLTGRFGDSDLAGRLTISMPEKRLKLVAALQSRSVDIIDIGPFIGYDPTKLATVGATAAATTQGRGDGSPRILPDAPLRIEALKAFDAHLDYTAVKVRAPHLPVSNIALTLDLDHNLLTLSPLTMDVAGGHLASDIKLNARDPRVVTDYDIRLSPTPMGRLLAGFGTSESGTSGVMRARIQMHGIGDSVRKSLATSDGRIAIVIPSGAFWMRNVQLAEFDIGVFIQRLFQKKLKKPVQINCGLIAFTVRGGVATADPILIDTDANVMAAKGAFNFADESVNLQFRADAKKFSIFSAQSPVNVGGHFAAPKLGLVTPQLLARGGAAVALGVVATPVGAVLAFVDPGDAKSAACGPVLAAAPAAAQRTTKGKPVKLLAKPR
jgi:uncharacterized protein involved in outer membrane biogenesis